MANLQTPSIRRNHDYQTRGFRKVTGLLAAMILSCLLAQNLHEALGAGWPGIVAPAAVLAAYLAVFFKPLKRSIDTPYFAILSLLLIALGTALGTFVAQNAPLDVFTKRYGETGSAVLLRLQLDDVFHSWWYVGLFALLAASLLKISWKRKFSREHLGYHLAHLGPVIVLAGFWVDYFYGFRGIIPLETGQHSKVARVYDGNTSYIKDSTELGFSIRLDHFEFEKHDPDYRVQIWRNRTEPHAQPAADGHMHEVSMGDPEIIASLPLTVDKVNRIYGTDIYFRLKEFYPNFTFAYEYTPPLIRDDSTARDPGVLLDLQTPMGDAVLQLLSNRPGRNKFADANHLGAWLEFYWERPEELVRALAGRPDAQWAEVNRIILVGAERLAYYYVDGELSQQPLEEGAYYAFPGRENAGFTLMYLYPDAAYMKSVPATDGEELLNPAARVEVWRKNGETSKDAYLYPGMGRRGGTFLIPESDYFLALESFRDMETKYYKSELSVLDDGGEVLKRQAVKVNEPMLYGGYRFYQTDYDPNNPNYSGIGISHEPGLYVIYFGFGVLVAGCFLMFYGRYRKKADPLLMG